MSQYTIYDEHNKKDICEVRGETPAIGTVIELDGKALSVSDVKYIIGHNPMNHRLPHFNEKVIVKVLPWGSL